MIRKHTHDDLERILDVWYASSHLAHPFLKPDFVEKVKSDMRNLYLPGSDTWVYETRDGIIGFISMMGNEIGGLFIEPGSIGSGIGTQLLNFIGEMYPALEVEVFEQNSIGRAFYAKHNFRLLKEFTHPETGEVLFRLKKG